MKRLLLLFIPCLVISSCSQKQKQLDNERLILGDWVISNFKSNPDAKGEIRAPGLRHTYSFTFYNNYIVDNKVGWDYDSNSGTTTNFRITNDSLSFFSPSLKKWDTYRIIKLTVDSLQFGDYQSIMSFKHYNTVKNQTPQFDEIILSTSICMLPCPVTNTIIDAQGRVVFKGVEYSKKDGWYEGTITTQNYQQLQDNFRKVDFNFLKNSYQTPLSDQQTISTTFVKNRKIYKTVNDYGPSAPYVFTWAYAPLQHLYQKIQLKKINGPYFLPNLNVLIESKLRSGNMVIDFSQSETFLLSNYLRNGKVSINKFVPRFKLHTFFNIHSFGGIDTDGRYYTFLNKGKAITIDIGFNFYDVNAKNWKWRKAGEYD